MRLYHTSPKLVNIRNSSYDIYIGRGKGSKWGNPFSIGRNGTREQVVEKYRAWILTQDHLLNSLPELEGKVLGCWCNPKLCHGDILIELVNIMIDINNDID